LPPFGRQRATGPGARVCLQNSRGWNPLLI